jgi:hypothetical protein
VILADHVLSTANRLFLFDLTPCVIDVIDVIGIFAFAGFAFGGSSRAACVRASM